MTEAWVEQANCRGLDPDLFFPRRGESAAHAIAVCQGCVVRTECLDFAVRERIVHGIWGGMSERARRRARRQRRLVAV